METKKTRKLTLTEIQNLKYFFSLVMEDYFGDKEELMKMADIDKNLLERFLMECSIKNKQIENISLMTLIKNIVI